MNPSITRKLKITAMDGVGLLHVAESNDAIAVSADYMAQHKPRTDGFYLEFDDGSISYEMPDSTVPPGFDNVEDHVEQTNLLVSHNIGTKGHQYLCEMRDLIVALVEKNNQAGKYLTGDLLKLFDL